MLFYKLVILIFFDIKIPTVFDNSICTNNLNSLFDDFYCFFSLPLVLKVFNFKYLIVGIIIPSPQLKLIINQTDNSLIFYIVL